MNTSRYFQLLLILLLYNAPVFAQNQNNTVDDAEGQPTVRLTDTVARVKIVPFVRLGIDLSSIARQFIETEVRQYEISLDSEIWYNWFAILEGGLFDVKGGRTDFTYGQQGFFMRAGMDYNLLKRDYQKQNDRVLVGLRYAYSSMTHYADNFYISNPYWGDYSGSIDETGFQVHWLEFSGGIKTEILRNLYLGWNLKARVRLYETRDAEIRPYYFGGYGHSKRRAPVMAHFSIYYKFGL